MAVLPSPVIFRTIVLITNEFVVYANFPQQLDILIFNMSDFTSFKCSHKGAFYALNE